MVVGSLYWWFQRRGMCWSQPTGITWPRGLFCGLTVKNCLDQTLAEQFVSHHDYLVVIKTSPQSGDVYPGKRNIDFLARVRHSSTAAELTLKPRPRTSFCMHEIILNIAIKTAWKSRCYAKTHVSHTHNASCVGTRILSFLALYEISWPTSFDSWKCTREDYLIPKQDRAGMQQNKDQRAQTSIRCTYFFYDWELLKETQRFCNTLFGPKTVWHSAMAF